MQLAMITGLRRGTSHLTLYQVFGWCPLSERRKNNKLIQLYKILNNETPSYLDDIPFRYNQHYPECTLGNINLRHPTPRKTSFQNSFFISTTDLWNNLNEDTKNICTSLYSFKKSPYKAFKITNLKFFL